MKCPFCKQHNAMVTDSRQVSNNIKRRRACRGCGHRFTTYEEVRDFALEEGFSASVNDMNRIKREMAKIVNFIKEAGYV